MLRFLIILFMIISIHGCGSEISIPNKSRSTALVRRHTLASDNPKLAALPGSYIVTFRHHTSKRQKHYASYLNEYSDHFSYLSSRFISDPRIKDLQFITSIDLSEAVNSKTVDTPDLQPLISLLLSDLKSVSSKEGSITRVDFTNEEAAKDLLNEWESAGAIWYAEPNYLSHLNDNPKNLFQTLDSQYQDLSYWWLDTIRLSGAFQTIAKRDFSTSVSDEDLQNNRPIIAVLDSGVDYKHPALVANIWQNKPTDINLSSCENDVHGCNTTIASRGKLGNGDVYPFGTNAAGQSCGSGDSNCSHGTHVAGLIVGNTATSTAERAAGVCPVCQIMILKIVGKVGSDSGILDSSIIAAFKYIALFKRKGSPAVRVINASFGKFARSRTVGLLIRLMKNNRDAIVIAAAGNEDTMTMEFPAAFSDAIAVAAVDQNLKKESFSNFGRWVDISAPGAGLVSTIPGGGLAAKSGTSMAAPLVAGVAGLMLARYPNIAFSDLRKWLLEGADPSLYRADWDDGFNYQNYYPKLPDEKLRQPLLGLGVVNAEASIKKEVSSGLPVYSGLDRVRSGCSVVGHKTNDLPKTCLFSVLIMPILLILFIQNYSRINSSKSATTT